MKFRPGISTILVSAVLVAITVCAYRFIATLDICDTRIDHEISSPDGKRIAVIFHRDCGATVDFNTQVSVVPAGTVFSFNDYPAIYSSGGESELPVSWLAPDKLQIILPRSEKIYRRDRSAGGVAITYK